MAPQKETPMSDLWPLRALPDNPAELPARLADFDCGKAALEVFLRTTAAFNQQAGEDAKHMFLRTSTARKLFEAGS